jgi:hypothetical protein
MWLRLKGMMTMRVQARAAGVAEAKVLVKTGRAEDGKVESPLGLGEIAIEADGRTSTKASVQRRGMGQV